MRIKCYSLGFLLILGSFKIRFLRKLQHAPPEKSLKENKSMNCEKIANEFLRYFTQFYLFIIIL